MFIPQNSFMKSVFFGQIREDILFPYPAISADVREAVLMIRDSVTRFAKEHIRSKEWDEKHEMPREILSHLAEMGMLGMGVPEEYGGLGLPQSGYARIMQEIAQHDGSLAITLGGHQSIGFKAILLYGTEEQKQRFLPRLTSGQLIACYCLTEPGSGSDAASIQTRATLSPDGKYYELTGSKLWITNAGFASFMTVFAKTEIEEKGQKKDKVTCFVIELPTEGVVVGPPEEKLGLRASVTNAIHFDRVKVPSENVVGGIGHGFKVAMGVLNHGRLGLAAGCLGGMRNCINASIEHCNERVQFQKKIGEFGMIKEKIARMMMNLYAAESVAYMTTSLIDRKDMDYSIESAIAKIFSTEVLWDAVDDTMQIWGGAGYMREYPFEQWMRDMRINRVFEGTNEILRAFVALAGMQGPGQELAGLAEAIKYPLKGMGHVSDFAFRKLKRSVVGESMSMPHPKLKQAASCLEETAGRLATQVEILLRRHGKQIHLRQLAQKRIADIAIDFYAVACCLSRATLTLEKSKESADLELEVALVQAFTAKAARRIDQNFRQIEKNEDDFIHLIADRAYELGRYPYDVI